MSPESLASSLRSIADSIDLESSPSLSAVRRRLAAALVSSSPPRIPDRVMRPAVISLDVSDERRWRTVMSSLSI
jgi:hypothetical protein